MADCWLEECVNCGKSTMVDSYGDNCQFCGKNVSKKEVIMVKENMVYQETSFSEERRPVPEKPKKRGEKLKAYWENNKTDILADYQSMPLREFFKRWHIATTTWPKLKELWHVESKWGSRGAKVEAPRPAQEKASPGGVALEAVNLAKHTEHEKYLILLGYQTAIREMLKIIPENPPE